jgi:hypothetical protein
MLKCGVCFARKLPTFWVPPSEGYLELSRQHADYAQRLDQLVAKRYLSEDEKIEQVRLKKLKLRTKDQMDTTTEPGHWLAADEQQELVHITLAQVPDAVTTYQGHAVCEVHLLEKVRPAQ